MTGQFDPPDLQQLAAQLAADATPEQRQALLDALVSGNVTSIFEELNARPEPTLLPVPNDAYGFRIRLDLRGTKPPVWRRLDLPGDLTLPQLHEVIQAAMGWQDCHLHRFSMSGDHRSPYFITEFDLSEGEDGLLETDVRLDQILAKKGGQLWYEYDFGDSWDHKLVVEEVLAEKPSQPICLAGRMACPPEDCGGIGGHHELATWVRSGYAEDLLPEGFENVEHGRGWLPLGWDPDEFDVEETNAALAQVAAQPVDVVDELADLAWDLERRGVRLLRDILRRPLSHGPIEITDAEAARLAETYRTFLETIGDGAALTAAGYLRPALVEEIAARTGVTNWWFGKANREDLTYPVAEIRSTARALGLVSVRKGRLSPTAAAARCVSDPQALWRHIVARLPIGTRDAERQSGWMALASVASGTTAQARREEIGELMFALGWRNGRDGISRPTANSATLDVLHILAGAVRAGWGDVEGFDDAVAATARAVIRRTVKETR